MDKLESLLKEITGIVKVERALQEEKRKRGENFNVFKILGLSSNEVRLHSAFLAELLNPDGDHGLGDKFLKSFINEVTRKSNKDKKECEFLFDSSSIKEVKVEKDIGPIRGEYGGRIDLCLADSNGCYIIIENKIYAGDQSDQMKRYWNYAQKMCKGDANKYRLIYLTLDGHEPSKESLCDLGTNDYICLSYKYDIVSWLNRCVEIAVRQPLLRETIIQYIDTLNQITYNEMSNSNEILNIMSKEEYLDAIFVIKNNLNGMICNIINDTLYPQLTLMAQSKGFKLKFTQNNGWMTDSWAGWSFEHPDWKNFCIAMEFEKRGLEDLIIGFLKKKDKKREDIECWDELWKRTTSTDKNNQLWIYKYFPILNWNTPESLRAIIDGSMIEQISEEVDKLIECTKGLDV
jgi:hypothetical protein